jgi:hypothetical protein
MNGMRVSMCWRAARAVGICCLAAGMLDAGSVPRKQLIGHGWDLLGVSPVEVARHADALAKTGLDGISLSLRKKLPDGRRLNFSSILTDPPWTKEVFADEIAALRTLHGKPGLSHCFLSAFWTPARRLAWDDDEAWARAIGNMKVLAEIAHDARIEGLLIDPEDYSSSKQFRHQAADVGLVALGEVVLAGGVDDDGVHRVVYQVDLPAAVELHLLDAAVDALLDLVVVLPLGDESGQGKEGDEDEGSHIGVLIC